MRFVLFFAVSLLALNSASAYEIEMGAAIICDTQKQAERLAAILEDNEQTAVSMVNAEEHDPTACAAVAVAFVRGATLATIRNKSTAYEVAEVLVVGVETDRGFRPAQPARYVTLFKIAERPA